MDTIGIVMNSISRRAFLGAASIGWLVSRSPSYARSPNPLLYKPRLLVVNYEPEPSTPELWPFVSRDQVMPQVLAYIEAEFGKRALNILVADRQKFVQPPADVPQSAVLFVTVRIDISKISLDGGESAIVGAVSLYLFRRDTSGLSPVPYELFVVPLRDELVRSTLLASVRHHLAKALIEPIAELYQLP